MFVGFEPYFVLSALECQPKLIGNVMLPPYCSPDIHNRILLDRDGLSLMKCVLLMVN